MGVRAASTRDRGRWRAVTTPPRAAVSVSVRHSTHQVTPRDADAAAAVTRVTATAWSVTRHETWWTSHATRQLSPQPQPLTTVAATADAADNLCQLLRPVIMLPSSSRLTPPTSLASLPLTLVMLVVCVTFLIMAPITRATDITPPDITSPVTPDVTRAANVTPNVTPDELQRTARTLGAESRMLFGFPTGSSITLTTSLITPIISEGPLTGKLNVTWVPVAVPLDQTARQMEYMQGARSRADDLVDVYTQLQDAIEGLGLPGRPCLLRTLCEAAGRKGDSPLLTRVLQLLLGLPEDGQTGGAAAGELGSEVSEARRLGSEDASRCSDAYQTCPGSLFEVLDEANLL